MAQRIESRRLFDYREGHLKLEPKEIPSIEL